MEERGLGRGNKLRNLLDKQKTPSGRTAPIHFENAFGTISVQPPRPAGRGAVFAALHKSDSAPPQLPVVGRGRALITATKVAASFPDVDAVISRMERLTPSDIMPKAEEPVSIHPVIQKGSSGTKARFTANHVRLMIKQDKGVFQYAVTFEPSVDSKEVRVNLLKDCTEFIGKALFFDGAILYLPFMLNEMTTTLYSCIEYNNSIIKIIIKYVCKHSFGDQSVIHLYDKLFRRIMNLLGMVNHGPNIFFDPNTSMSLSSRKLEIWPGYVTAIDEFEGGLMLSCDATHRIIQNQTVLELLQYLKNSKKNTWKDDFINCIVGQSVITKYNYKVYQIVDVEFNKSPKDSFGNRNGEKMTYKTHYAQRYELIIKEEGQPLLISKHKKGIEGQPDVLIVLIPELCYLTWINDELKGDLKDITQCKQIKINPQQRMDAINKYIRNVKDSPEATQILVDWGISLNDTCMELPGRILPSANIIFGDGIYLGKNAKAIWFNEHKVLTSIEIYKWSVICPRRDEESVALFIDQMQNWSSSIGLRILRPKFFTLNDDRICSYIKALRSISKSGDQIVMVVLPLDQNDINYNMIKKVCLVEDPPILTQVIRSKTIQLKTPRRAFALRIAKKMNCKLGGTAWSVHIPWQNTMVCGLDIYHDQKGWMNSVGAFVSSLNQNLTRWYSRVYFQPPGYGFVNGLAQAMFNSLDAWYENNKMYPEQVIVYRNGLSDDQIKQCRDHEIPQIMNAFKNISFFYKPKFLFVVTQKKINTKYFLTNGNRYINPPPGSILDHSVTRQLQDYLYDFFLVSHRVSEATTSPTHYIVVHNTTNMTPDEVQRLSFILTHLYCNVQGTVNVPAPCRYAGKLAYLVGEIIHEEPSQLLSDKLFYL